MPTYANLGGASPLLSRSLPLSMSQMCVSFDSAPDLFPSQICIGEKGAQLILYCSDELLFHFS